MIPTDPFLECFYEHKIRYIGYQGKSIIFKDYYKHVCFKICDIVIDVSLLAYRVIWSSGRSSNYHTHGYECNDISRYLQQEWCGDVCMLSHVQLCNPMDCSPLGSSVHGIFQARILEWIAISYSRGSANPGIKPGSLASPAGRFFTTALPGKPMYVLRVCKYNTQGIY